jgi:hypothetical protein
MAIAMAVLFTSMFSKIQIGVRHLLPVIPLIYLLVCLRMARARWIVVLIILIALSFVETGAKHPDYLSFFNIASSRGCGGKLLLLDSNLDWGQDLARLARWLREGHASTPYETRLFGSACARDVPDMSIRMNEKLDLSAGLLIVSKKVKYGLYPAQELKPTNPQNLSVPKWIFHSEPIKRIGDSLEVYDLSQAR